MPLICHAQGVLLTENRAFNIGPFEDGKPAQNLPSALEAHAAEIERFQKYCMDLVLKLLTLFSIGLEVCRD